MQNDPIYKAALLAISCLLFNSSVVCQIIDTKHFKIEDGFGQVKILSLFKSHMGYIYTGTSNGIYKFDGLGFTQIPFTTGSSKQAVTAIFEDNQNQLWAGSQSGDIAKLVDGKFQPFAPEEGTSKKSITHFLQDKQNNTWFSTDGEGIYYTCNNKMYNINSDDGLSENNVYTMALTDNGEILAGTDQGISICKISGAKKTVINLNSKNGLPDNFVKVIIPAGNNNYWIGMQDKGVCLYNNTTRHFSTPSFLSGWHYGQVNSIVALQNTLWVATEGSGILRAYNFNDSIAPVKFTHGTYHNVSNLLPDNEGNVWIVNNSNELIKTGGEQLKLLVAFDPETFADVHSILCDRENNIWRGIKGGVIKYTGSLNNKQRKFIIKELDNKTDITSFYQDKYNHIWIGTMGKGVFILDPSNGQYRGVYENKLLQNSSVLSITGKDDEVFISSLEGAVMFKLPDHESADTLQSADFSNIGSIGNNYIYNIFKDSKSRTWFATDGKGITVLQNEKFINYSATAGLKDEVVYSITEDHTGNIWFSTHNAGLYKFDGKSFTNYSKFSGLSDINISAVKTDRLGNIVIINEKGIDVLNPANGQFFCINENMGIKEINIQDLGSVTQDTSLGVLVSTTEGIVLYHPSANMLHRSRTILESVQLFFKEPGDQGKNIFSYDENHFTFSFTGLYYSDPEAVSYKYKLEPYNSEWITTKDRTITFPQLPPGPYKFRIRSFINEIFNESNEATYDFSIKKPFWRTIWFLLLCIGTIAGLFYWYVKIRERRLKRIEHLQQEKIRFKFETLRSQVNPHFLFNSFNTLISTIEEDPKMAVEYVEQLSEFFRNIVNYRDKDTIALGEEISLLQTYFFIQQKRFGQNLRLNITLSEQDKKEIFIPPLTLQLIAENAIKHNAVSKETPLIIDMFIKNGMLFIRNNINLKITKATGTGMGLQNIINRYAVLTTREILIDNDNLYFTISLPVIKRPS